MRKLNSKKFMTILYQKVTIHFKFGVTSSSWQTHYNLMPKLKLNEKRFVLCMVNTYLGMHTYLSYFKINM